MVDTFTLCGMNVSLESAMRAPEGDLLLIPGVDWKREGLLEQGCDPWGGVGVEGTGSLP